MTLMVRQCIIYQSVSYYYSNKMAKEVKVTLNDKLFSYCRLSIFIGD